MRGPAWACLFLLFLWGCQPYQDHEVLIHDASTDYVNFGHKRQLRLLKVEPGPRSLLLTFNQPLRFLGEEAGEPPFVPSIEPRLAIDSVSLEGIAGVRITFAHDLLAAHRYRVIIPPGWRALSGASLLQTIKHDWETDRPELLEVSPSPDSLGAGGGAPFLPLASPLTLVFNQPISLDSLGEHIRLLDSERKVPLELEQADDSRRRFHLHFEVPPPSASYRLVLEPGVRSLVGTLPGRQALEWLLQPEQPLRLLTPTELELDAQGRARLDFDGKVRLEELRRVAVGPPWAAFELDTLPSGREFSDSFLLTVHQPRQGTLGLTLVPGLQAVARESTEPMRLALRWPQAGPQATPSPLTPVTVKPDLKAVQAFWSQEATTLTWGLSRSQAVQLSQLEAGPWGAPKKLPWEMRKPQFRQTPEKPETGEEEPDQKEKPPLPKGSFLSPKAPPYGFYLLRRSRPDQGVERALVVRSDLRIEYALTPGAVTVRGESLRLKRPRAGAIAELLDARGRPLASGRLDAEGKARFDISQLPRPPFAAALRWGKDRNFVPLQDVRSEESKPRPGAFLATDLIHYAPGERVVLHGFLWPSHQTRELSYRVEDEAARVVRRGRLPKLGDGGLFEARFRAPERSGTYRAVLELSEEGGPADQVQVPLRVGRQIETDQEYDLELGALGAPGTEAQGRVTVEGLRGGELALTAEAHRRPGPVPVAGWVRDPGLEPHWTRIPLALNQDTLDFTFQLPWLARSGGAILKFELTAPHQHGLELVEKQVAFLPEGPQLELAAPAGGWPEEGSEQDLTVSVRGAEEQARLVSRLLYRPWEAPPRPDSWIEVQSLSTLPGESRQDWRVKYSRPGLYALEVRSEDGSEFTTARWETTVESRSPSAFEIVVPRRAYLPGETFRPVLTGLRPGTPVHLTMQGATVHYSEPIDSSAPPLLTVPDCRSEELRLTARALVEPGFGEQRVPPLRSHATLPISEQARRVPVTLELPEEPVQAGSWFQVTVRPSGEQSDALRGFLLSRLEDSLHHDDYADPYLNYVGRPQPGLLSEVEDDLRLFSPRDFDATHFHSDLRVQGATSFRLRAPEKAGRYYWTFVGVDEKLRFAYATGDVEVAGASRWRTVTPSVIRQGDSFQAGLEVEAASSELAPIGLNASVTEEGGLLPSSFFSTNALIEPGEKGRMLFRYVAPSLQELGDALALHWELGLEGRLHEEWARVPVRAAPPVAKMHSRHVLGPGQSRELKIRELSQWALSLRLLRLREPARVEVVEQEGRPPLILDLTGQDPQHVLEGNRLTRVRTNHLEGGRVQLALGGLQADGGEQKPYGEQLYLMRRLLQGDEPAPERLRSQEIYTARLRVLNPDHANAFVKVRFPLPGGARPLEVRADGFRPDFRWESGELLFEVPSLPLGESIWDVTFQAHVPGDFLWPVCEVSSDLGTLGYSGSSRVVILP